MKKTISLFVFVLFPIFIFSQRVIYNSQNQINRYLEDPSFISSNDEYNITAVLQGVDSDISNTSEYIAMQLAPFDNVAFGLDYSKHTYQIFRYFQMCFNGRYKVNFGNEFHNIKLGASIGMDRLNIDKISRENKINSIYKLGLHYTNFNLTIGGFLNNYPLQNDLNDSSLEPLTNTEGYTAFLSYAIRISDSFRITPMSRYNVYSNIAFFEGVANFNYKGACELAVSYKNNYSISPSLSGRFLKFVKVSYAYESAIGAQIFSDVHSLGVSVDLRPKENEIPEWLANVKRNKEKINRLKKVKEKRELAFQDPNAEDDNTEAVQKSESIEQIELREYPLMSEEAPTDILDGKLLPGYYIILGSYKKVANAKKKILRLREQGYYARYGKKDANDDFNYVYVDRYKNRDIASKRTFAKQREKGFEKVWLLRVK